MNQPIEPPAPSKTQRVAAIIAAVSLGIAAVGVGLMLYWASASTEILTIKNSPVPVRAVEQNGDRLIILSVDYCKNINVTGTVRISFVSPTTEVFLPITQEKSPATCSDDDFPIILPKNLLPDEYKIKFHMTYDLNPLKKGIVQDFESKPFNVNKGGAKLKATE